MANITPWKGILKRQVAQGREVLTGQWSVAEVLAACQLCRYLWRDRFWNPLETIWTFLLQVLHDGSSCREAVAMVLTHAAATDSRRNISDDPSAYCQARGRLPLPVLRQGVLTVGQHLRDNLRDVHTWCGKHVWLVDGTSCSMPDTPSLQEAFGQPDGQAKGCGFPVARIVAMFCWASGAVLEAAIGPYRQSEISLWRSLWHLLRPGEIVLADRYYCTYSDIAGLLARGCDCVFRLHQRRERNFAKGTPLGKNDLLVQWERPKCHLRPRGMTPQQWAMLPEQLTVRLLRFAVDIPGFRSRTIFMATSLLDPIAYPAQEIAALYRDRWLIELRFRDIKITLGMDTLRGKTPDIVRKEIHMHLLAYNLIRALMWQAAAKHGRNLHRLSFAGTVDRLNAMMPYLWLFQRTAKARKLCDLLLQWIAHDPNPDRPNRIEPRAVKRRPKQYPLLNKPRNQMRKALLS
jgi:hypothetical protein